MKTYQDFIKLDTNALNNTCKRLEYNLNRDLLIGPELTEIYNCFDAICQKGINTGCIYAYNIIRVSSFQNQLNYHTWYLVNKSHSQLKKFYLEITQKIEGGDVDLIKCKSLRDGKSVNLHTSIKCALIFDFNFK